MKGREIPTTDDVRKVRALPDHLLTRLYDRRTREYRNVVNEMLNRKLIEPAEPKDPDPTKRDIEDEKLEQD